jgi:cobalamin-dependent methionine synthase I
MMAGKYTEAMDIVKNGQVVDGAHVIDINVDDGMRQCDLFFPPSNFTC